MSAVPVIARRELGALFVRSAAGWALLGALALVNALHFLAFAVDERRTSERALEIYFHHAGYVMEAAGVLVALGFVAAEGPADVLWRTAPIRAHQVVLGRFAAGVGLLALGVLGSLHLPALILWSGHASLGHLASGALGQLAVGSLALSLGLAATAAARRPVAGALGAGCLLAALELSPMLAARADAGVRAALALAAPVWTHNDDFRRGLLDLGDATFLVGLTYVSLVAAALALEERRWAS